MVCHSGRRRSEAACRVIMGLRMGKVLICPCLPIDIIPFPSSGLVFLNEL